MIEVKKGYMPCENYKCPKYRSCYSTHCDLYEPFGEDMVYFCKKYFPSPNRNLRTFIKYNFYKSLEQRECSHHDYGTKKKRSDDKEYYFIKCKVCGYKVIDKDPKKVEKIWKQKESPVELLDKLERDCYKYTEKLERIKNEIAIQILKDKQDAKDLLADDFDYGTCKCWDD